MADESRHLTSVRGFSVEPSPAAASASAMPHQYDRVGSTGTLVRRTDGGATRGAAPLVNRGRPAWPFMSTLGQTAPSP